MFWNVAARVQGEIRVSYIKDPAGMLANMSQINSAKKCLLESHITDTLPI